MKGIDALKEILEIGIIAGFAYGVYHAFIAIL